MHAPGAEPILFKSYSGCSSICWQLCPKFRLLVCLGSRAIMAGSLRNIESIMHSVGHYAEQHILSHCSEKCEDCAIVTECLRTQWVKAALQTGRPSLILPVHGFENLLWGSNLSLEWRIWWMTLLSIICSSKGKVNPLRFSTSACFSIVLRRYEIEHQSIMLGVAQPL